MYTVKHGRSDATCPFKYFFCSQRTNTTFNKSMQWSNMPVNEVVVNDFSTSFGGLWLQMAITTMRRHAGVREYRPGAGGYDQRARDVNG